MFQHLHYRPWYALAEFVDNALQSALENAAALQGAQGSPYQLNVKLDVSADLPQSITIHDNAAGIDAANFDRAFKTAQPPLDQSGLSEFGVGMKSAAFWFTPRWELRTSALGEPIERMLSLDINDIITQNLEELHAVERPCPAEAHFTELTLLDLYRPLAGRTVGKIKAHLASMYRRFTANGTLRLDYNGVPLLYDQPPILEAAPHSDLDASRIVWRKEIDFDLGGGMTVRGFAALRAIASTSEAGFALFRRGRLIQGSADEGYRPQYVFGSSNKYTFQRLFGELDLEGFDVTHTKDGFQWDENESAFLELLKEHLKAAPLNLLDQAEGYRVRADARNRTIRDSLDSASEALSVMHLEGARSSLEPADPGVEGQDPMMVSDTSAVRELVYRLDERLWRIRIHLDDRENPRELYTLHTDEPSTEEDRTVSALVRIYLNHPFAQQVATGPDMEFLTPLIRILGAFAVAELVAAAGGVEFAGAVRRAANHLLSPHSQREIGNA